MNQTSTDLIATFLHTGRYAVRFVSLCILSVWIMPAPAHGAPPTPGNFIVTVNEFTGSSTAPTYISEHSISGNRVQVFDYVPVPGGGPGPTTEQARDLVVGSENAIYLYNGTFTPYLARFDTLAGGWTEQTFAGWSTVNNGTYGGLTRKGQYLFAADMWTASGGEPQGVVRFDMRGGPTVRFPLPIEPMDLNIGPDGVLYALDGAGSPRTKVFKYDPVTFDALGIITVAFADHRAVAVAADRSIFLADWSGVIRRYSDTGTLLDSLTITNANFSDIDIDSEGRIILGTGFDGEVIVTDITLNWFAQFNVTDVLSLVSGDVFVSWVPPSLALTVPSPVSETSGVMFGAGRVAVSSAVADSVTVTLVSSNPSAVSVPANVTIPAGASNAIFDVTMLDDTLLDGPQSATITASAADYNDATAAIAVTDNETATLSVILPSSATEGANPLSGQIRLSSTPAFNVVVNLLSSDTTELQVPSTVTIPSGQTSAVFSVTVVDDNQIDGSQTATVTAQFTGWTSGNATLTVADNEPTALIVTLPASATEGNGQLVNAGRIGIPGTLSNALNISLSSSDTTELTIPASVTIPAGQTFVLFNITIVNDSVEDGVQTVSVTASASGFSHGSTNMLIYDDETPAVPTSPTPTNLAINVSAASDLSWLSGETSPKTNTYDVYFGTNSAPDTAEFLGSTTNTSWTLPTLAPLTTYYWKIVSRRTGQIAGPTWRFTTRGVDRFVWNPVGSPQLTNKPIAVSLTAKDEFNTTVTNFTGTVALSASSGATITTNTMMDSLFPDSSNLGTWTLAYTFTPNVNIIVTHVRRYMGKKVSIWIDSTAALVASQNVTDVPETWTATPLTSPVTLSAGTRYRLGAFVDSSAYYWHSSAPSFPHGTIEAGYYAHPDGFPTNPIAIRSWCVGLTYNVSNPIPRPMTPTNSGNFVDGVWTGFVNVPGSGTNIILRAADNAQHFGVSTPFYIASVAPRITGVAHVASQLAISFPSSVSNYVLEASVSLAPGSWVVVTNLVATNNQFVLPNGIAGTNQFYRLRSN